MFSKITAIKPPKFGFALANESKLLISRRGPFGSKGTEIIFSSQKFKNLVNYLLPSLKVTDNLFLSQKKR